jgi:hypothetical protein
MPSILLAPPEVMVPPDRSCDADAELVPSPSALASNMAVETDVRAGTLSRAYGPPVTSTPDAKETS